MEYHPRHSVVGIVWTAATAAAMFTLAAGKARTGRILAVAVLIGLVLNAAGWWWAYPAAGCVLISYAAREIRDVFTGRSPGGRRRIIRRPLVADPARPVKCLPNHGVPGLAMAGQ